ncbi:MAG: PKD domain-containing protein, partial [Fibrobacteria bacterium]|nr:PKD domain-containing protein [Fibrobacteria bacterium]
VFYFGCTGTNTSKVVYIPDMDPIMPYCNVTLYSRLPMRGEAEQGSYYNNGGVFYGSSLKDFMRFGPGKEPPAEVVWDWDSRQIDDWWVKIATGILMDIYVKYNQWPDRHSYIDTKHLIKGTSISHNGTNTDSPKDWILTMATPGRPNETIKVTMPVLTSPAAENNSLPALTLKDTRPILFAASFDHQVWGDYPRDWHYYEMVSDVLTRTYNVPAKITGAYAVHTEFGERGLWISPSSATVCNHNMATATFGDGADWTDYRMTFTVKHTTGDHDRHQVCQFYMRIKDDPESIVGYQFNLFGGTSISVRNWQGTGADISLSNIHKGVDIWGGGEPYSRSNQLVNDKAQTVNPFNDRLKVTLEAKGNKISSTYDNGRGGVLTLSATDDTYSSGKPAIGVVYGNYIYNNILVEDLSEPPAGNLPVCVIPQQKDTATLNEAFQFSAENSIYSGDQSKLTYLWDFGDGFKGSGQRPSHIYMGTGTYRVTCTISDGINSNTDGLFVTVTGPTDNTPPSNITDLKASVVNDVVTLSWSAATDAETGISGYTIYRGTSENPTTPLITVRNITEFIDHTGIASTTLHYRVKAHNGIKGGSANFSNNVSIQTETTSIKTRKFITPILSIFGNPASNKQQITVQLPRAQNITLEIVNTKAQVIHQLYSGKREKGKHIFSWNLQKSIPGLFFVRLKTKNHILSRKVIRLK